MDGLNKTVLTGLLIFWILFTSGCTTSSEKIKIGFQLTPASTLVQIAQEKGFFEEQNLDVEIIEFTAGKFAFQAMLSNSVDLSVVGDIPVMLAKAQDNDFYVVSEVGENQNEAPVAVIDDGSKSPQEYFSKKRKISTSLGGTPEFSFYLFMKTFEIEKENVEVISQKPEEMIGAISSGSVDGIAIFEPYPSLAEEKSGKQIKRFELPKGVYPTKYLLAVSKEFAGKNPKAIQKIMIALKKAKMFANDNSKEAQEIIARQTKFEKSIIEKIWKDFEFELGISDELLNNWKMEKAWAIETGKIQEIETNFNEIIWMPNQLE